MLIENNESFLSELTRMFTLNRQKNGASLYITMKKYRQKIGVEGKKDNKSKSKDKNKTNKKLVVKDRSQKSKIIFAEDDNKCIIRAKIGSKKISTIISLKDVEKFQTAYSSLLRGNLYGLKDKKKEAKKTNQAKSKSTAN